MSIAEEHALTERQRYWLEHIQSCEAAGKTIAEYATDQGIEAQAMYAGKKILIKKGVLLRARPRRFQRAQVVGAVGGEWCIQLPNGVSVTFAGSVEAGALATVLNTAASLI